MKAITTDVLIVGGGACGLTSSIILSDLGIDHYLIERRAGTTHTPKAHYYNQRMMEIYRQHEIDRDLYAVGMPMAYCKVRGITSLGGEGSLDGQELYSFDAFGGKSLRNQVSDASPARTIHLSQIGLEPILKQNAQQRAPDCVQFHHELLEFEQDAEGITAKIHDRDSGNSYTVRAKYMIGADGGRMVGPQCDVALEGHANLGRLITAPFKADLSAYVPGDSMITHLFHPESRYRWGAIVPMGPQWSKYSENWTFTFAFHPDDPTQLSLSEMEEEVKGALGLPNLELTVERISEWTAQSVLADRFQFGRIFLAGDAAHRVIPTSGLGLNSAVHDAHNLCWKLALVIKGKAAPSLLDTYDVERRQAGARNCEWSLFTYRNLALIPVGLGMTPGGPVEENVQAITEYLSDTRLGRTLRARGKEVINTQRTEYGALEIELGGCYESSAIVGDGTNEPDVDPMGDIYTATTRPGHRLPHAWLTNGGNMASTHDFTGSSANFALITGSEGRPWRDAVAKIADKLGVQIVTASIGIGQDYGDHTGAWDAAKDIDESGAILVRPDNIVAYRSKSISFDPAKDLFEAVAGILGRS